MQSLNIPIEISPDHRVSAIWTVPENYVAGRSDAVILAHGAGNDMHHPFMTTYHEGLAQSGFLSIKFNFPYKELGKKAPDRPALLLKTWAAVVQRLRNDSKFAPRHLFLGGKSMGGRMASIAVAEGVLCDGLFFLGYPLHPPKQPEKARIDHWPQIPCPSLFVEGTRDSLCDLDLLRSSLPRLGGPSTLITLDGGDHSFKRPKTENDDSDATHHKVIQEVTSWIQEISGY